jgi:hypothetical protein
MHDHDFSKTEQNFQEMRRARPIFAQDIQQLGGVISVVASRDLDGGQNFRIRHISAGGDCSWLSPPVPDIDRADSAALILAAFVGGEVVR